MVRHSDSWKRLLVVGVVILGGLMLIADTAGADRMSLDLTCSTTVPATGGPVSITLTRVSNDRGQPVSIAKSGFMVHLGGVNIVGPFVVPFVLNLTAFQVKNNIPYIATSFPAGLASSGSFVTLIVGLMDSTNRVLVSQDCTIQIL